MAQKLYNKKCHSYVKVTKSYSQIIKCPWEKYYIILQSIEIKQKQELQKLESHNMKGLGNSHILKYLNSVVKLVKKMNAKSKHNYFQKSYIIYKNNFITLF